MQINCSSAWQQLQVESGNVEFDADIVGPGAVASFTATALMAFLTTIAAFVTYSVPEELANEVDEVICRALRAMLNAAGSRLDMSRRTGSERGEVREERLEAFQSFMISVSDQVLAAEIAILIAAFARYRDITLYSVNVVVALGCLASTVHLALIPLLIRRMQDHHVTKTLRCVSMVAAVVLLVTLLVLQLSKPWQFKEHVYFRCAVKDFGFGWHYVYDNWLFFAMRLLVLYFVIYSTYKVIQLLYSKPRHDPNQHAASVSSDSIRDIAITKAKHHNHPAHTYNTPWQKQRIRRQWLRYKAQQAARPKMSLRKQRFKALMLAESWAFYECHDSFTWRIPWLLSGNIYGIADVFSTRADVGSVSGDHDAMGYGQIVSLVLLVLPFFAAAESIYDYRDRVKGLQESRMQVSGSPDAVEATTVTESATSRPPSTADSASSHPQPRPAPDPSDSTECGDGIANIFRAPTIETLDANGRVLPAGIDGSLWHLAQDTESYGNIFFARAWTYVHALFMLVFAILLGWATAMPDGPVWVVGVLYSVLGVIVLRRFCGWICFSIFARRIREGKIADNGAVEKPAKDQTSK